MRKIKFLSETAKDKAKFLIKQCVSCQLDITTDKYGNSIFGYGHRLTPQELAKVKVEKQNIQEIAQNLLNQDLEEKVFKQAQYYWGVFLKDLKEDDEWRFAAILDVTYSCGSVRWPKLSQSVFRRNWEDAAEQLMDSRYSHQVGNRAKRNACILRDGRPYTVFSQNWDKDEEA